MHVYFLLKYIFECWSFTSVGAFFHVGVAAFTGFDELSCEHLTDSRLLSEEEAVKSRGADEMSQ